MTGVRRFVVGRGEADLRLDRWFRSRFPALSHGRLEKMLRTGQVRLDGRRVKASERVVAGQEIRVPPGIEAPAPGAARLDDEDRDRIRGLVLYRDRDLIAIDKPSGLAVQGGSGVRISVDALLDGLRFDAEERPRLVHRLDKDTSGVLLLARSRSAARTLSAVFKAGALSKEYWALVDGVPDPESGTVDNSLAKRELGRSGRERMVPDRREGLAARTFYRVVDRAGSVVSWLALSPLTGRTHQLRVHCRCLRTPILGDGKYGFPDRPADGRPRVRRLMLHARAVRIPRASGGPLEIDAPLDREMRAQWDFYGFDPSRGGAFGDG